MEGSAGFWEDCRVSSALGLALNGLRVYQDNIVLGVGVHALHLRQRQRRWVGNSRSWSWGGWKCGEAVKSGHQSGNQPGAGSAWKGGMGRGTTEEGATSW